MKPHRGVGVGHPGFLCPKFGSARRFGLPCLPIAPEVSRADRTVKVIIARDASQACSFAAHFVVRQVQMKPDMVLGLATGTTMIEFYRKLVARHRAGDVSFRRVTTFNLDEYVRLPEEHPGSFHAYMRRHFFDHVDLPADQAFIPNGNADPILAEAESYEERIRAHGGIDLQVLGLGQNGHIAFNEPGSSLSSRTRVKRLEPETRAANARDFGGEERVPPYVITMGVGTILDARFILLLATGVEKSRAVKAAIEGPITAWWPASALQMHRHAFVLLDGEAACLLTRRYDTVEDVLSDPYEEYFWEGK